MEQTLRALYQEYPAIDKALGKLRRQGVLAYVEQDELISAAAIALMEAGPVAEGLAVTTARRAMIDVIRRNEVRQRGREYASAGHVAETRGWVVPEADQWDSLIYREQNIQPDYCLDLWEAMVALPAREFRVISLSFWAGRTQEEIADELGVSRRTVIRIFESAKKNLASCVTNRDSRAITTMEGDALVSVGGSIESGSEAA